MILPNVGLNEWGHTFWFMEELFVAPLHYGFVIFGWLALSIMGVLLQVFGSFAGLIGKQICEAVDQGMISK
jgi:methane/ammonia monooxygenase subunit C